MKREELKEEGERVSERQQQRLNRIYRGGEEQEGQEGRGDIISSPQSTGKLPGQCTCLRWYSIGTSHGNPLQLPTSE
jgi:hypothetical protein